MTITYRDASQEDAIALAPHLRAADRLEVMLAAGDVEAALLASVAAPGVSLAAVNERGEVIALFGMSDGPNMGIPWMLASDEVDRHPRHLVAGCRRWVLEMLPHYQLLLNYVHAENTTAIAWLRHIGFTIGALVEDFGVAKAPFYQFYMWNKETNV